MEIFVTNNKKLKPGPASTVGDRPPTNPEIRVRFPPSPKQMESFSRRGRINARPRFSEFLFSKQIEQRHLLEKSGLQVSLCMKGVLFPE